MTEALEKEVLLSVRDIGVTFGRGRSAFRAVRSVSFDIYRGETFGIVGESGSGKTTIGRSIMRIQPLSAGEILFKGQRISGKIPHALDREITSKIQMIFQDPMASLNERAKVEYIVAEGLYSMHRHISRELVSDAVARAVGRRPAARVRQPLPARVLRRPAPAHRHRPRTDYGAGIHHRR